MRTINILLVAAALAAAPTVGAQDNDSEQLKLAAVEALITAPPDRAVPLLAKVLRGQQSVELKLRALFVLGQFGSADAQALLVDVATNGEPELRLEAVRMIGINGNTEGMVMLGDIYATGDAATRDAVLDAYMIAGDEEAVFQIAMNAESATEFERAVQLLGAMGAADKLRQLSSRPGDKSTLINAYAVSGDVESLRKIAAESDNPEEQHAAIRAMGIVGGSAVNDTLVQIYKESDSDEVKSAALEGLMVSGYDEGVIELYRASSDNNEKRELLRMLTTMGSDEVWTLIDDALGSDQ